MPCYPDQDSYALLNQLSRILNKPNADILEDMGTYLVMHRNQDGVRRLLRFGGADFRDFLFSLNEFNAQIDLSCQIKTYRKSTRCAELKIKFQ